MKFSDLSYILFEKKKSQIIDYDFKKIVTNFFKKIFKNTVGPNSQEGSNLVLLNSQKDKNHWVGLEIIVRSRSIRYTIQQKRKKEKKVYVTILPHYKSPHHALVFFTSQFS